MGIKAIVRNYLKNIRNQAQAELEWFRQQPDLNKAIEHASLAINSKGKRYGHQRRLKNEALEKARNAILAESKALEKCRSFDELFQLIDSRSRPIKGIGELYIYDTTLRIGAKLNLLPEKVYLHAGTREGAKALGLDEKSKAIDISLLPKELQYLEPHEIEDVLCIFKSELKNS